MKPAKELTVGLRRYSSSHGIQKWLDFLIHPIEEEVEAPVTEHTKAKRAAELEVKNYLKPARHLRGTPPQRRRHHDDPLAC